MSKLAEIDTSKPGFLIGALLWLPADEVRRRVQAVYETSGFTDVRPAHHPVFGLLSPDGDRVVDLAERAQTTKQAMGYLVAYLEERGYLERVPDPNDGRAKIVRRTVKGWEVNRAAGRAVRELQAEWAEQLGEDRMEQLILLLRDLMEIIGFKYEGSVAERSVE